MQNLVLAFTLSTFLDEADTKKKKRKLSGHSEGGEPENHGAPAKGIAAILWRGLPSRVWGEEATRGLQADPPLRRHGEGWTQIQTRRGSRGENGAV